MARCTTGIASPADKLTVRRLWILLLATVVALSLLPAGFPGLRAVAALPAGDKLLHFLAYAILAGILPWVESRSAAACTGLVGLSLLLELLQQLVPGRSCDPLDALANATGALCGLLAAAFLNASLRRLRRAVADYPAFRIACDPYFASSRSGR